MTLPNLRLGVRMGTALLLFVLMASPAYADPITVSFTALPAPGDPVNLRPSRGTFTFDSSLIPPGGGDVQNWLGLEVIDINFHWGHTLFTKANAGVGELLFSSSGQLLGWEVGGLSQGILGIPNPPLAFVDDFWAYTFAGLGGGEPNVFLYTVAGHPGSWEGSFVTDSVPAVPEPSTILLLGGGLIAVLLRSVRIPRLRESQLKTWV